MESVGHGYFLKRRGMTLIEVTIATALLTMVIILVGGLAQQAMKVAGSSRQASTILQLRSQTTSIVKNQDAWLAKMRSSIHTQGIFAGCLPDAAATPETFDCPAV